MLLRFFFFFFSVRDFLALFKRCYFFADGPSSGGGSVGQVASWQRCAVALVNSSRFFGNAYYLPGLVFFF